MGSEYIALTQWKSRNLVRLKIEDISYWILEDGRLGDYQIDDSLLGSTFIWLKGVGGFNVMESPERIKEIIDGV